MKTLPVSMQTLIYNSGEYHEVQSNGMENPTHSVILSNLWDVATNNGYQYMDSEWATVTTDSGKVSDKENWEFHTDLTALPPS